MVTGKKEHTTVGIALAVPYLALVLFIEIINYFAYLRTEFPSAAEHVVFILTWPFAQVQHLLVAVILFVLGRFCVTRPGRLVATLALIALHGITTFDQLAYQLFHNHAPLEATELNLKTLGLFWDSTVALVDWAFILTALWGLLTLGSSIALIGSRTAQHWVQIKWLHFRTPFAFLGTPWKKALIATTYLLLSGFVQEHDGLENALLISYSQSLLAGKEVATSPEKDAFYSDETLQRLYHLAVPGTPDADKETASSVRITQWLQSNISQPTKPNIVLLLLESIGSKQLLKDGLPDPHMAPNLAKIAQHSLTFEPVYTSFPGTTRSQLPLLTGGYTITHGNVYHDLNFLYQGPSIPRFFQEHGYRFKYFQPGDSDFENQESMFKNLGIQAQFHIGNVSEAYRAKHRLSSWGLRDDQVAREAVQWWKQDSHTPTFLYFNTLATHHPYKVPAKFLKPFPAKDNPWDRYRNAVAYVDSVVGDLVDTLIAHNPDNPPIFFILGDHGEPFGRHHKGNFTHQNFLYEENVRSFLFVFPGHYRGKSVRSETIGSHADLFPTLLDIVPGFSADAVVTEVVGQSLVSPQVEQRIPFFNKIVPPHRVGLRHGKWKFSVNLVGQGDERLFNLEKDPNEQTNLAKQYPKEASIYRERAVQWLFAMNQAYIRRLKDYKTIANYQLTRKDYEKPGPKAMSIGIKTGRENFKEFTRIHPEQRFKVINKWTPYPEKKTIHFRWTDPSGRHGQFRLGTKPEWSTTWTPPNLRHPLEEGHWSISLLDQGKAFMTTQFTVDAEASLHRLEPPPSANKNIAPITPILSRIGIEHPETGFKELGSIHPEQRFTIHNKWQPTHPAQIIRYFWTSPSGKRGVYNFRIEAGWDTTWVKLTLPYPLETGKWSIELFSQNRRVHNQIFAVDQSVALQ